MKGISKIAATFIALLLSSFQVQGYPSGVHAFIKTPVTAYPRSFKSAALTALSTPPDNPTNTRGLDLGFKILDLRFFCS